MSRGLAMIDPTANIGLALAVSKFMSLRSVPAMARSMTSAASSGLGASGSTMVRPLNWSIVASARSRARSSLVSCWSHEDSTSRLAKAVPSARRPGVDISFRSM